MYSCIVLQINRTTTKSLFQETLEDTYTIVNSSTNRVILFNFRGWSLTDHLFPFPFIIRKTLSSSYIPNSCSPFRVNQDILMRLFEIIMRTSYRVFIIISVYEYHNWFGIYFFWIKIKFGLKLKLFHFSDSIILPGIPGKEIFLNNLDSLSAFQLRDNVIRNRDVTFFQREIKSYLRYNVYLSIFVSFFFSTEVETTIWYHNSDVQMLDIRRRGYY